MSISKLAVSCTVSLLSLAILIPLNNTFGLIEEVKAQEQKNHEIDGTLTVNVPVVKEGTIDVSLYKGVNDKVQPYRQHLAVTAANGASISFAEIPMGDYTVTVTLAGKKRKTKVSAVTYTDTEVRVYGPTWKKGQFHMNKADMTVVITKIK